VSGAPGKDTAKLQPTHTPHVGEAACEVCTHPRSSELSPINDDESPLAMFDKIVDILFAVVATTVRDPAKCKRWWCNSPPSDAGGFCQSHDPLQNLRDAKCAAENKPQRLQQQQLTVADGSGYRRGVGGVSGGIID